MNGKQKMVPTTVYLNPATKRRLKRAAAARRCKEADIIRDAIEAGLQLLQDQQKNSIAGLLELARFAEKTGTKGPRDLSTNLDKYLWDENE